MANEAIITTVLRIDKGNLHYQSQPGSFTANIDAAKPKGPVPGAIAVATAGTDISLSQLDTPGLVHLRNLDDTNFVEWGIRIPATSKFVPIGELLPGESFVLRLSRNLLEEYTNTGTGTSAQILFLHFKADTASVNVLIEAFEK